MVGCRNAPNHTSAGTESGSGDSFAFEARLMLLRIFVA
jgi:hypothetical protein